MYLVGGKLEMDIKINPLELIDVGNYHQQLMIKNQAGVMQCSQFKMENLEEKNMQEVYLSPVIEEEKMESRFMVRHAFV